VRQGERMPTNMRTERVGVVVEAARGPQATT